MGEYTDLLVDKGYAISPEDDDYKEKLLDAMQSFRTFDVALDEFILQNGYSGDISDTESKIRFIKSKFDEAGIPLDVRVPGKWYCNHTQGDDRSIAFQICFAFRLTLPQTQEFFRRVYLQRGIDCHDVEEAIYYYCLRHQMTYSEARELIARAPHKDKKGRIDLNADVLFTASIIKELDRFDSSEALLSFLNENSEQFGYNNATAKKYINEMWKRIAGENGLAYREALLLYPYKVVSDKHRSVWDIYLQIFGLLDYDDVDHSKLFPIAHDRTLQPLLKRNRLIHPVARKAFPDRQGLEKIIRGEYRSNEVVRKTMILLAFYRFWSELSVKGKTADYPAEPYDAQRCLAAINRLLTDTGYPALYEGNPYDWIFLFSSWDEYPLGAFRFFMRELYLNREECGEPL